MTQNYVIHCCSSEVIFTKCEDLLEIRRFFKCKTCKTVEKKESVLFSLVL